MDHRALLVKYIRHVADMEGTDFLHEGYTGTPEKPASPWTADEVRELMRCRAEAGAK